MTQPNPIVPEPGGVAELLRLCAEDYASAAPHRMQNHRVSAFLAVDATPAPVAEPSDLEVAISVGQQLLDSDSLMAVREALRLPLRALGAEPPTACKPGPEVLRLRMQMRAAGYNPDLRHQVEALACVVTIDTDHLAAVLAGHAPIDWRIPRERLARTLGVDEIDQTPVRTADNRCPAAHPEDPTPCGGPVVVTVLDAHNAGTNGCEHHGARLLASLKGGRVYGLPDSPEGAAIRTFKAAAGLRPFCWCGGEAK